MIPDILIILFLIVCNGVFSMAELAVVSARRPRLTAMSETGNKGAAAALELANEPSKFLSTIQIGITLIGILSGAYSGATIALPLADYLAGFPSLGDRGHNLAIVFVVACVTYLSLVIGELTPKQLALRHAETIASAIARPMQYLAVAGTPFVLLLDWSNRLVLRIMGVKQSGAAPVTQEEVKAVIAEGTQVGVFQPEERRMLERVMRLDDILVTAAMTHRQDIVWLDIHEPIESVLAKMEEHRHSRYLLCDKSVENVTGIVVIKDLTSQLARRETMDLIKIARKPHYIPNTTSILEALEKFKRSTVNMAVILDEYGGIEGILTLKDAMETIVGILPEPAYREDFQAVRRPDGTWLVDGLLPVHQAEELLGIPGLAPEDAPYDTLAGFLMNEMQRIPKEGDTLEWRGWRFEVLDMDGRRIDKVLITLIQQN